MLSVPQHLRQVDCAKMPCIKHQWLGLGYMRGRATQCSQHEQHCVCTPNPWPAGCKLLTATQTDLWACCIDSSCCFHCCSACPLASLHPCSAAALSCAHWACPSASLACQSPWTSASRPCHCFSACVAFSCSALMASVTLPSQCLQ